MGSAFADLRNARYISLTTYRRDGTPVATPVWSAMGDGRLYVQTGRDSGKVKRLRRDPRVTLARCRASGRISGPAVAGRARILDAEDAETAARLLRRKYGWQKRLALALAARRGEVTIILELAPA